MTDPNNDKLIDVSDESVSTSLPETEEVTTDVADDALPANDEASEPEADSAEISLPPEEAQSAEQREQSLRLVEAILFANNEPVTPAFLQTQLSVKASEISGLLSELQAFYAPRGVNLVNIDGAWSFRTAKDLAGRMKITKYTRRKLPRAASEVLAIIAYHQPVTRAEIETIRGVDTSKGTLDILLELGWVRPGKRRDTPGRPLTWQTTSDFLSHFNIGSLKELPGVEDLKAAGLLDAKPILETLPREKNEVDVVDTSRDDEDFAAWIKDEPDAAVPEGEAVVAEARSETEASQAPESNLAPAAISVG